MYVLEEYKMQILQNITWEQMPERKLQLSNSRENLLPYPCLMQFPTS